MTLFFRHLRQSTCILSRDIFTSWGDTIENTPTTHLYRISLWTPLSSTLVPPSSLTIRDFLLLISWIVPNYHNPWYAGTTSEVKQNSCIRVDDCKTDQGFFSGIKIKMGMHLDLWHKFSFFPSPGMVGHMLSPTPWYTAPYLSSCIWRTGKSILSNRMDACVGSNLLWKLCPCPPLYPEQRTPWRQLNLLF